MLIITVPIMIIMAIALFLYNNFATSVPEFAKYTASSNFLLYHDTMYSYAVSNLNLLSPPVVLSSTNASYPFTLTIAGPSPSTTYFSKISYTPMGDYNSYVLTYNGVKYLVSSFSTINGDNNDAYANKTLKAIAEELQTPDSSASQNYQAKIALINSSCTPTILNVGLTGSVVNSTVYSPIFTALCNSSPGTTKKYVLLEALQ